VILSLSKTIVDSCLLHIVWLYYIVEPSFNKILIMWEICNGNKTRAQTFKLQELPWLKGKQTDYRAENVYTLLQDLNKRRKIRIKHKKVSFLNVCCVMMFYVFLCRSECWFLYEPFCHGTYKLGTSTLFTTFFLWATLQFILILSGHTDVRTDGRKDIRIYKQTEGLNYRPIWREHR